MEVSEDPARDPINNATPPPNLPALAVAEAGETAHSGDDASAAPVDLPPLPSPAAPPALPVRAGPGPTSPDAVVLASMLVLASVVLVLWLAQRSRRAASRAAVR